MAPLIRWDRTVAVVTGLALLLGSVVLPVPGAPAAGLADDGCGPPPNPVDLLFLFDVSTSMNEEIADVKAVAQDLTNNLSAFPNLRFGIGYFSDYPDRYTYPSPSPGYEADYGYEWSTGKDTPWVLALPFTDDATQAAGAIQALPTLRGADRPESYSRAYHEATNLGDWRPNALKLAVVWGDSHPHDQDLFNRTWGLDPGPDAEAHTGDDLDYQPVVEALVEAGLVAMAVDANVQPFSEPADHRYRARQAFQYLAEASAVNQPVQPPVDSYVRLDNANALEDHIVAFIHAVLPIDPPTVTIHTPEPGFLYDGTDVAALDDPEATPLVVGQVPFHASAQGQCPVTSLAFATEPDVGWGHTETGNESTPPPFPGDQVPEGLYLLNVTATDTEDNQNWSQQPFQVVHAGPPDWNDPGACTNDGSVDWTAVSHNATLYDGLVVESSLPTRTLTITTLQAPDWVTVTNDGPADPVTVTLSASDPQVGDHAIVLEATDDEGLSSQCHLRLLVENPPPVADPACQPTTMMEGESVRCWANATDPNGEIVSCQWTLGDGATSDACNPDHTYDDPGDYDACLTATDDDGASVTPSCIPINVLGYHGRAAAGAVAVDTVVEAPLLDTGEVQQDVLLEQPVLEAGVVRVEAARSEVAVSQGWINATSDLGRVVLVVPDLSGQPHTLELVGLRTFAHASCDAFEGGVTIADVRLDDAVVAQDVEAGVPVPSGTSPIGVLGTVELRLHQSHPVGSGVGQGGNVTAVEVLVTPPAQPAVRVMVGFAEAVYEDCL